MRVAAVEFERDALFGPRGVGDVAVAVEEQLVLEPWFREPELTGTTRDERLPLVSRSRQLRMQLGEDAQCDPAPRSGPVRELGGTTLQGDRFHEPANDCALDKGHRL